MRALLSLLVAGATMFACAQIAGIDSTPASGDGGPGDGDGAASNVEVDPSSIGIQPPGDTPTLDFEDAACGVETAPKSITITNNGTVAAPYSVTVPQGSGFRALDPTLLDGTLETSGANKAVTIQLVAKVTTIALNEADVQVKIGKSFNRTVHLSAKGSGAIMRLGQSVAAFGDVRMQSGGSTDVLVYNDGTKDLSISQWLVAPSTDFTVDWAGRPAPLVIPAGANGKVTVNLIAGAQAQNLAATLTPVVDGALCGTTQQLAVSGNRVNSDVIISIADFGKQSCGSSPAGTAAITITNYSPSGFTVQATLTQSPSQFTLKTAQTAVSAGGATPSTATLTLGLNPISASPTFGVASEPVRIDTISGTKFPDQTTQKLTSAQVDIHGALLLVSPPELDFHNYCNSWGCIVGGNQGFSVQNTGNDAIALSWNTVGGAWNGTKPSSVGANATANGSVNYYGNQSDTKTLTVSNGSPATVTLCNTPASITLKAQVSPLN